MGDTVRNVIKNFLDAAIQGNLTQDPLDENSPKIPPALNPDILSLYNLNMETQVNVCPTGAESVEGRRNTWTKDGQTFWNIRVPKNAMQDPHWHDYELKFSLTMHAEAVGMTGWDWANKRSRWVAFDFDAISGHAPGVGVTDEKLQQVREAAVAIPWVQTRKSTRGGGLHMYVFFDDEGVPTENHSIHQGLARCVLSRMSQEAGFNFASAIDACGGNMWVWHRDATAANEGFLLLHEATQVLSLGDLPINWRDHVDVVTRKRTKIKVKGVPDSEDDDFDTMASSRNIIPLDDSHRLVMQRLSEEFNCTTVWVPEYNLLQTHTIGFAQLRETYPELYSGFFETNSEGSDPGQPNCFAFPMPQGGWKVYRFSKGHHEHESWTQDGRGYTSAYFNCRPDLETAALSMGAAEIDNGFQFTSLRLAERAAHSLGADLSEVADWMDDNRETELQRVKSTGRLKVKIEKRKSDIKPGNGWVEKRVWWEKIFKVECNPPEMANAEYPEFDNVFRAMVTSGGEHAGWAVWDDAQTDWDIQPMGNVKLMLQADQYSKNEAETVMGSVLKKRWRLVNMPFQPEFPGNRQWNYQAPQLRYSPAMLDDDVAPHHPHWDMILDHIGEELTEALPNNSWAVRHGIKTGRQYIQLWIAAMLREPFEPLPYLFLHGPENSGKSILHEAIGKLITGGICRADKPLTTNGEHNGELANAVLAVVEETNLNGRGSERALARMKEWVTSETISIRRMRTDAYLQLNTLHFIHCANDKEHCLIMHGDTRITMMFVRSLESDTEIPKAILKKALETEAPHFMTTLMDLELPPTNGRLRIPIVTTKGKAEIERLNMDPLTKFINEETYRVLGAKMPFSEFFSHFQRTLEDDEKAFWANRKVSSRIDKSLYPTGKCGGQNVTYIGNIAWDPNTVTDGDELFTDLPTGRLRTKFEIDALDGKRS